MKTIDFLPDIYRQRAAALRARVWRGVLVVIFGAAIGAAAVGQQLLRRSVQAQLAALEPRFLASQEHVRKLADLHTQSRAEEDRAGLVTYLGHPWPRTQLLAEVVRPLPRAIRLTELTLSEQDESPAPGEEADPRGRRPTDEANNQKQQVPPAASDLAELRKLYDRRQTVVEVTGQTTDAAPLHEYVAAVGRSPFVTRAQLKSIESVAAEEGKKQTRFTLRVLVKPGYRQPESLEEAKSAAPRGSQTTAASSVGPLIAQGGGRP